MLPDDYRDLLLVSVEDVFYVVDAPAHEAAPGDLVEFRDSFGHKSLGKVDSAIYCRRGSMEHSFVRKLKEIHHAVKIYRTSWAESASVSTAAAQQQAVGSNPALPSMAVP